MANWQQSFSEELIKEALVRASLQDKRTIAYVGGILKNWSTTGKTTAAEVRQEKTKPNPKGGKRNVKGKPGYYPTEVDWANEPDKKEAAKNLNGLLTRKKASPKRD